MTVKELLYNDTYKGPRWRYGLTHRPVSYANVPTGWIIWSNRDIGGTFRFGTLDWPRELTPHEVQQADLTPLGKKEE